MNRKFAPPFTGFTEFTPTIPKLYWEVESQEQRIHRICEMLHKLACYSDFLGDRVNINRKDIDKLISEFEEFKEQGFEDYYLEQIEKWIKLNLEKVMHLLIRNVYFGLNLEGYFVAYVPDSWAEIMFDTGADFSLDTYGRLILRFDVDSPETVDQTPEPNYTTYSQVLVTANNALSLAQTNEHDIDIIDTDITDLESRVSALEA